MASFLAYNSYMGRQNTRPAVCRPPGPPLLEGWKLEADKPDGGGPPAITQAQSGPHGHGGVNIFLVLHHFTSDLLRLGIFREGFFPDFLCLVIFFQNLRKALQDFCIWGIIAARRLRLQDFFALLASAVSLSQRKFGQSIPMIVLD